MRSFRSSFLTFPILLCLAGCGVDTSGVAAALTDDDGSVPDDAGDDGTIDGSSRPDGGNGEDGGDDGSSCVAMCGDDCVSSCALCPGKPAACDGVCLSSCATCNTKLFLCPVDYACKEDCAGCAGRTVECASCTGQVLGLCQASAKSCPGVDLCPCSNNEPSGCPGPNQVCLTTGSDDAGACTACGKAHTDGRLCKGGNACSEATERCEP
jgi:hypothetical protein